jgi:hypothetical protein
MVPLSKYKVASVQSSPIFFDAAATVAKTVELIKEAAQKGASLVVFPELWVSSTSFFLLLLFFHVPFALSKLISSVYTRYLPFHPLAALSDPWVSRGSYIDMNDNSA